MSEQLIVEELYELAREQLRREYQGMREALVKLWQSGRPISEARKRDGISATNKDS